MNWLEAMDKRGASSDWIKFLKQLEAKCEERNVSFSELTEWIRYSIEQIQEKAFDYTISAEPATNTQSVLKTSEQRLSISILLDNYSHNFSVQQCQRIHSIANRILGHGKAELLLRAVDLSS